jgi:transposase-like protein
MRTFSLLLCELNMACPRNKDAAVAGIDDVHRSSGMSRPSALTATRRKGELQRCIRESVAPGSELYTDALRSYDGLDEYAHKVIDHAEAYVDGNVHTNRLENFWSLLKRAIKATYVSVEPFHLFRYLDEQSFRYNERHATDAERFGKVLNSIAGERLTWDALTCQEAG